MAGIYLHIPFCRKACHYCDFHFSTNQSNRTKIVEAIAGEMVLRQTYLSGEQIETIYFGGGTPSLLPPEELNTLLATIRGHFGVSETAEITLEANPDDITLAYLSDLKQLGINRLSIGIQTFQDTTLGFINRIHLGEQAYESVVMAKESGFSNISLDLMYGIPGQTRESWEKDIEKALSLHVPHISAYHLTLEPDTVFGKWQSKGRIQPAEEEISLWQMEKLITTLQASEFVHYEISNFGMPGHFSRHNTAYWQGKQYLGVGPGAHSFNGKSRRYNKPNNMLYINGILKNHPPVEEELLSPKDKLNEYIMTRLRTIWGINPEEISLLWMEIEDKKQKEFFYRQMEDFISDRLLKEESGCFVLTHKGKLFADRISSDLFLL